MEDFLLYGAAGLSGAIILEVAKEISRRITGRIVDLPTEFEKLSVLYSSLDRRVTALEAAIVEFRENSVRLAGVGATVESMGRAVESMREDLRRVGDDLHSLIGYVRGAKDLRN